MRFLKFCLFEAGFLKYCYLTFQFYLISLSLSLLIQDKFSEIKHHTTITKAKNKKEIEEKTNKQEVTTGKLMHKHYMVLHYIDERTT